MGPHADPALVIVAVQVRRIQSPRADSWDQAALKHEGHGAGDPAGSCVFSSRYCGLLRDEEQAPVEELINGKG